MDQELYHYGIKGMKWGIRRTDAQLGHKPSPKKNKKRPSLTKNDLNHGKRKTTATLSDIKSAAIRGKKRVDRFMNTNAGMALKSAAFIGLATVGVLTSLICLGNYLAFGQSPMRTLGLDTASTDAKYEAMRGQVTWVDSDGNPMRPDWLD